MTLYLDGAKIDSTTIVDVESMNNSENLIIGNGHHNSDSGNGTVDDIIIWDRVLSYTEIQNNISSEQNISSNGMLAHYKFNAGSGLSLIHI